MKEKLAIATMFVVLSISYVIAFFLVHGTSVYFKIRTGWPYLECKLAANQYWLWKAAGGVAKDGN
jgi:hypothetical protein